MKKRFIYIIMLALINERSGQVSFFPKFIGALQSSSKWFSENTDITIYSQLSLSFSGHFRDLELVSSLARVRNSGSLFQSNICNVCLFLPRIWIAAVLITGVSVIGESFLTSLFTFLIINIHRSGGCIYELNAKVERAGYN